jgi:hypothetical protein
MKMPEELAQDLDRLSGAEVWRDVQLNKQREALRVLEAGGSP